jgi:glycosyltransferase involved in cell wall biosynthesis
VGLKVLWHSTVPWGSSSYSVLTKRTVPGLVGDGHKVTLSTWYGLQGEPQVWRVKGGEEAGPVAVPVLPSLLPESYGVDVLLANYQRHEAQVLISCMDVWVLPAQVTARMRFCPWLPVDFDPAPALVVEALGPAVYPMVFSRFGVEVLARSGIEAHYVPCSADASAFKPLDRDEARAGWKLPAGLGFLVTMVAANKDPDDRKGLTEALVGFARFAQNHDDAHLYLHTSWQGPVNVGAICEQLGISERVLRPDEYAYCMGLYPDSYMQMVYSASDVLLNTAHSEGFGLPMLEAQLCGCPIAATDFSSTREIMAAGWPIPGQPSWLCRADSFRLLPYVDAVAEALQAAYDERGNQTLREQARAGVLDYDTATVHERYWRPALKEIEEIVEGRGGGRLELVTF